MSQCSMNPPEDIRERGRPHRMHHVALIYNPASGQHPQRRAALIKRVVAVLPSAAIEVKGIPTESAERSEHRHRRPYARDATRFLYGAAMAPCMEWCEEGGGH